MHTQKTPSERLRGNIWKLYVLKALRGFMLAMPIFVLFLQDIGLSMTEVFITQSVFAFVVFVAEIPSGYFADRYGMRLSLILGSFFAVLGIGAYSLSFHLMTVLFAEVLLGISLAFISGADSALLYETTHALDEGSHYKKREGRLFTASSIAEGIASILGGFVALISLRAPLIAHTVVMLGMLPIAWSLYEPPELRKHAAVLASGHALTTMWKTFMHTLHTEKALAWLVYTAAIIDTATLVSVWFRQPYFELAGLPLEYFGVVWALLMFCVSIAALFAEPFERLVGKRLALVLFVVTPAVGYFIVGSFVSLSLIPVFMLFSFVRGFKEPLMRAYVQELALPEVRATILSIKSFVSRIPFIVLGPLAGWAMDAYSIQTALMASGVMVALLGIAALGVLFHHLPKVEPRG